MAFEHKFQSQQDQHETNANALNTKINNQSLQLSVMRHELEREKSESMVNRTYHEKQLNESIQFIDKLRQQIIDRDNQIESLQTELSQKDIIILLTVMLRLLISLRRYCKT